MMNPIVLTPYQAFHYVAHSFIKNLLRMHLNIRQEFLSSWSLHSAQGVGVEEWVWKTAINKLCSMSDDTAMVTDSREGGVGSGGGNSVKWNLQDGLTKRSIFEQVQAREKAGLQGREQLEQMPWGRKCLAHSRKSRRPVGCSSE